MPIFETFSKRASRLSKAGQQDVFQYEDIPSSLRVQITQIFDEALGLYSSGDGYNSFPSPANEAWEFLCNVIRRENGLHSLSESHHNPYIQVKSFILNGSTNDFLDMLELACKIISEGISKFNNLQKKQHGIKQDPKDAVIEINYRLREHSVGFEFINGQLIRIDSQYIHSDVVIPVLNLLRSNGFNGANDEFRSAYSHYKSGEYKDAIVDAHSSFESVLKSICDIHKWDYPKNATGANVLTIVKSKGLFPDYLDNSFDQLLSVLKSGLPKLRNEEGGHGQGSQIKQTPSYVASFALHLAASKMLFLLERHNNYEKY